MGYTDERARGQSETAPEVMLAGDRRFAIYHRPNQGRSLWHREPELARQVMTAPVICVGVHHTLADVADVMASEDVGIVPVVDEERRLLGVVTDRDIALRAFDRGRPDRQLRAGDVMTRDVCVAAPDDRIDTVVEMMRERRIQRVPVVDLNTDRLLGIISLDDIGARSRQRPERVRRAYASLAARGPTSRRPGFTSASPRAGDIMTAPALAVHLGDPISHVAALMRDQDIGLVPVVDSEHRLRGLITDRDLVVRVLAAAPHYAPRVAAELMTANPETASPDDTVTEVLHGMARAGVHRLPVVDPQQRLLGVVSVEDVARCAEDDRQLQRLLRRVARKRTFWHRVARMSGVP